MNDTNEQGAHLDGHGDADATAADATRPVDDA